MAVTKTPRKKSASTPAPVEETKPAAKAKAASAKKPAGKKVETTEAEPEAIKPAKAAKATKAPKAPAKTKGHTTSTPGAEVANSAVTEPAVVEPAAKPEPAAKTKPAAVAAAKVAPGKPVLSPLAQAILVAICEGRAVEFIFADADANAPRTFEPRQLTFDALSQAWYVWGWDRRYNAERHHRVDLLAEVNDVEGVGRAAQGPYPEGTAANQIGGWLGGEPIAVKATLLKQWVFAVKQAPPAFPQFKIEEQGDGQALVSFAATDLRAIARWAMQFGDGIQVLEPARLVDRIKQVGAVWAGRDRQPAPAPAPKFPHRSEPAPEPRRQEFRPASESKPESKPHRESQRESQRESRPDRDRDRDRDEAPKGKPGKVEIIRFDRL